MVAASLKPAPSATAELAYMRFPRLNGRGLIEADAANASASFRFHFRD